MKSEEKIVSEIQKEIGMLVWREEIFIYIRVAIFGSTYSRLMRKWKLTWPTHHHAVSVISHFLLNKEILGLLFRSFSFRFISLTVLLCLLFQEFYYFLTCSFFKISHHALFSWDLKKKVISTCKSCKWADSSTFQWEWWLRLDCEKYHHLIHPQIWSVNIAFLPR